MGPAVRRSSRRVGIAELEVAVDDEVGRLGAADGDQVDRQPVDVHDAGGAEQADRHDGVARAGGDGDPLGDAGPAARPFSFGPGAERAAAGRAELVAEEVDDQAGILAEPFAGLDLVEADPEADDRSPRSCGRRRRRPGSAARAGRASCSRTAGSAGRPRPPRPSSFGVAEVVPAVGDAVLVGVGLEVVERRRRGPDDRSRRPGPRAGPSAIASSQATASDQGDVRDPSHGFSFFSCAAASRWAGRSSARTGSAAARWTSTSLPSLLDLQVDHLVEPVAQRDHHPPPLLQLLDERGRDLLGAQVTITASNGAASGQPA